ncbi:MAG TPA: hypothetical protein VGG83_24095, partial [Trebonia sp.]
LADRLQQLLANPDLRAKLGSTARDWVARDRTWAHNAARYREIYNSLRRRDPADGRQDPDHEQGPDGGQDPGQEQDPGHEQDLG